MSIEKIVNFNIKTLLYELYIARIAFVIAAFFTPLVAGVFILDNIELLNPVNSIRFGAGYLFCLFFLFLNVLSKDNAYKIKQEIDAGRLKAIASMSSGRFKQPSVHLIEVNNNQRSIR